MRAIEQLLRRNDTRFQLGFATEAKELVPEREEFLLAASRKGLHVLARNEEALAAPVEVLRDLYGPKLEVEPPRVRLLEGVQVQEPIMQVRISLQTRYRPVVMQALDKRGAARTEEYVRSTYCETAAGARHEQAGLIYFFSMLWSVKLWRAILNE